MDIQPTIAPSTQKTAAAEKADKAKDVSPAPQQAAVFSQLLQGLQHVDVALPVNAEGAAADLQTETLVEAGWGAWDVQSLLGQTRQLDAVDRDAMLQDGRLLTQHPDAGGVLASSAWAMGTQPHIAAGQTVATVAAGVQASGAATAGSGAVAAMAVLAEGAQAAEAVLPSPAADGAGGEAGSEGRWTLQGAWKLEDAAAPSPPLQRLMGQIEQWAAASAGVQPKPQERIEAGRLAGHGSEGWSAGAASGTRLTEEAVAEAQAAPDAAMDAQAETAREDMRFWLQGKQQRAEVILDKDGQAVRVQVSVRGNEAQVMFQSDAVHTRALLDASLEQLRAMLAQQGVQLTGVSVQAQAQDAGAGEGARHPWQEGAARHAQVEVPQDVAAPTMSAARGQGLSLYA